MMPRLNAVQIALVAAFLILAAFAWDGVNRAKRAEQRAAAAEQQSRLDVETTRQLDHYTTTTTVIREKAQEAENAVRTAPGADAPLDPDNRRVLCAELERVRDAPVCAPAAP